MEQYWMDEQDIWGIEFIFSNPLVLPNVFRKQIFITCKDLTLAWGNHKIPQAIQLGLLRRRPSSLERLSNIGEMNKIYGILNLLFLVHFPQMQLESKFVSHAKP
jgi:hypothetical protein